MPVDILRAHSGPETRAKGSGMTRTSRNIIIINKYKKTNKKQVVEQETRSSRRTRDKIKS